MWVFTILIAKKNGDRAYLPAMKVSGINLFRNH